MTSPPDGEPGARDFRALPSDFDAARVSDDDLVDLGLPPILRASSSRAASIFRRNFLAPTPGGPPLRLLAAPSLPSPPPSISSIPGAAIAARPAQKSVNWSGGYLVPRDGRSFVSVMGRWTVPTVSLPGGPPQPEYRSSTWIGLDGQKFYLDSSLPQIGTSQRWLAGTSNKARYAAWFQWWARGLDTDEIELPLPVAAGDEISAIITVQSPTSVRCHLKNVTQGIILAAFDATAPGPCRISGATAEWVMERPSPPQSGGWEAYALPSYTPFAFADCIAESRAPGSAELHDHDLERVRLIRMYQITAAPPAVRTVSTAQRLRSPAQKIAMTYTGP